MFCPECGAEYREGVNECSDCRVSLVAELQAEPRPAPTELVTVLTTGNAISIALAKSLLDESGIPYLTKHEGLQDLFPVGEFRIDIQVRKEDEIEARELLSQPADVEAGETSEEVQDDPDEAGCPGGNAGPD